MKDLTAKMLRTSIDQNLQDTFFKPDIFVTDQTRLNKIFKIQKKSFKL